MITRSVAQDMVQFYLEAERAVLAGRTIQKDGRTLTRENLAEIIAGRRDWEQKLRTLSLPSSARGPAIAGF